MDIVFYCYYTGYLAKYYYFAENNFPDILVLKAPQRESGDYFELQQYLNVMEAAGVTEELKACDPMRWVRLMNTLKAQAEEIVLSEIIFN